MLDKIIKTLYYNYYGGAIKLTQWMQEREHTQNEYDKLVKYSDLHILPTENKDLKIELIQK